MEGTVNRYADQLEVEFKRKKRAKDESKGFATRLELPPTERREVWGRQVWGRSNSTVFVEA